ncbi:conserved hypothetical protein [Pseudomonas sp. 8Z]|uniref:hypothetical protein n=1 Tax=Pseudomonas sp. 8Z TaxID=2653166 RepID=UPI0012EFBFFC|nr:hypothetical protein [Pseudomonas sp. 8Z]VXC09993.1 conserved hypothetical protein [Pseudomonas sp. 8Z]
MQKTRLSVASPIATIKLRRSPNPQAGYICEYFSGSVAPTPGTIQPSAATAFVLTSGADIVSGMRFVYTSGTKKCRFAASRTVNVSTKVPSFTKTGTSIGSTRATCNATITAVQTSLPYNYTVEFEIK